MQKWSKRKVRRFQTNHRAVQLMYESGRIVADLSTRQFFVKSKEPCENCNVKQNCTEPKKKNCILVQTKEIKLKDFSGVNTLIVWIRSASTLHSSSAFQSSKDEIGSFVQGTVSLG